MSLTGVLSSPSQRRSFLLASTLLLLISMGASFFIVLVIGKNAFWENVNDILVALAASGIFAIVASLYMSYFFVDPDEVAKKAVLLPEDIGAAISSVAENATEYKIVVRTGRHFRAEVLPKLIQQAVRNRRQVRIEVILLDFRNTDVCERYASFRGSTSFDRTQWSLDYVRKEVISTILALMQAADTRRSLLTIDLYLSRRLSTFRIEGSSEELIITREDPRDVALRYLRVNQEYSAYATEFVWIRDEADPINKGKPLQSNLKDAFGPDAVIVALEQQAMSSLNSLSPYVR